MRYVAPGLYPAIFRSTRNGRTVSEKIHLDYGTLAGNLPKERKVAKHWGIAKRLRHRTLTPASFVSSNLTTPAHRKYATFG